jgi:hypothetical protein
VSRAILQAEDGDEASVRWTTLRDQYEIRVGDAIRMYAPRDVAERLRDALTEALAAHDTTQETP